MLVPWLTLSAEVAAAVADGRPVVALESTLIAHGLPWPANLETAREAEAAVRAGGAIPATVAVWNGTPTVGLADEQLIHLARASGVFKASRRDLGAAVGLGRLAATTVSATMALAHAAGVRVFATGRHRRRSRHPRTMSRSTSRRIWLNWPARRCWSSVPGPRASCTCRGRWRFSKPSACRCSATEPTSSPRSTSRPAAARSRAESSRRPKQRRFSHRMCGWGRRGSAGAAVSAGGGDPGG